MADHAPHPHTDTDPPFHASCTCGWRGTGAFPTLDGAHAELVQHLLAPDLR